MKKLIVIIDDSELMLVMTSDVLTEAGYEVATAINCIEANQYIFGKQKPDLILMDVMMPMLQGDATVQILKKSEFSSDIPMIYVSSKSPEELEQMVVATGVEGYLCKPFSEEDLLAKVQEIIG